MYVIRYTDDDGGFVALDMPSGGYPYRVPDVWRAQTWTTVGEAQKYKETMGREGANFALFEVFVNLFPVVWQQ